MNILVQTDSYKQSHYRMYPPGTEKVYSYIEGRKLKDGNKITLKFFGLQYIIKKHLVGQVVTKEKIREAKEIVDKHLGPGIFNEAGWNYILKKHNGHLPIQISAVVEGSPIKTAEPLVTIENTDKKSGWLVGHLETLLLQVWYPITVATRSNAIYQIIHKYLEATGNIDLIGFKLHDFGYRGCSSDETAAIGGAAHLTNFMGTDTLAALTMLNRYYKEENVAGFSIPASEHSTITSWGRESEPEAIKNLLEQYPEGLVACVCDSFDIFKVCEDVLGKELKDLILNRNGTLVVRPDSGDPTVIIPHILELLAESFGVTTNNKGYKVLDDHIRVLWGDGINEITIEKILKVMKEAGWSADNVAFGMGGALLQQLDRDTYGFACKCSAIKVNGKWRDVYKDPITDPGKVSKKGRFTDQPNLIEVYKNGKLLVDYSFEVVRNNGKYLAKKD